MSIITTNDVQSTTTPTHAELLAAYVASIKAEINATFHINVNTYNNIWNSVYGSKQFTDAEIFAALGTDAVQLLIISQAFGTAINTVVPNTVSLTPPDTLNPQADGSVTVTPAAPDPDPVSGTTIDTIN